MYMLCVLCGRCTLCTLCVLCALQGRQVCAHLKDVWSDLPVQPGEPHCRGGVKEFR